MKQTISLLSTALLVLAMVGCAATSTQQSTGQYFDDAAITTKVKAAMVDDPNLSALDIGVNTHQGVVQLSGFVASPAEVNHATEIAGGVAGVKAVKNDIQIKEAGKTRD